jgi:hypothetical protein
VRLYICAHTLRDTMWKYISLRSKNAGCLQHSCKNTHGAAARLKREDAIFTLSLSQRPAGIEFIHLCGALSSIELGFLSFFLSRGQKGRRKNESHDENQRGDYSISKCSISRSVCLVQISKWSHKWAKYACFCVYLLWPDDASLDAWARWRTTQGWLRLLFAAWFIYS